MNKTEITVGELREKLERYSDDDLVDATSQQTNDQVHSVVLEVEYDRGDERERQCIHLFEDEDEDE